MSWRRSTATVVQLLMPLHRYVLSCEPASSLSAANSGQVIGNLCASKETMSLQRLCNALSRKPRSMDVMLQFTSPISILQPLCNLLDGWRYEEDQGVSF